MSSHETASDGRVDFPQPGKRLGAVQTGHAHVQEDQGNFVPVLPVELQRCCSIGCQPDAEPLLLEHNMHQLAHERLVVHDQDAPLPGLSKLESIGLTGSSGPRKLVRAAGRPGGGRFAIRGPQTMR
jgi:hypothetical protein